MKHRSFYLGFILIATYWLINLPGEWWGPIGYVEDFGHFEITRVIIADAIQQFGKPEFVTNRFMAPTGDAVPFMTWSMERDWLGAYAWLIAPNFPWLWFYFGLSLLASYWVVGYFAQKMRIPKSWSWAIATLAVLGHIPRHFKAFHQMGNACLHWSYANLFFDAFIWWRLVTQRRWSFSTELWRLVVFIGVFQADGYQWGPAILLWVLFRVSTIVYIVFQNRKTGAGHRSPIVIEWGKRKLIFPIGVLVLQVSLHLIWFLPLLESVLPHLRGGVYQPLEHVVGLTQVLRPYWYHWVADRLNDWVGALWIGGERIHHYETIMILGWFLLIPLLALSKRAVKQKQVGLLLLPMSLFFLICILYGLRWFGAPVQWSLRSFVPFMSFFRVASRMGLLLPVIACALLTLGWSEVEPWFARLKRQRRWYYLFILSCVLEWGMILAYPLNSVAKMPAQAESVLSKIRQTKGDTVLDLPFCVHGGNHVCFGQCANYPTSLIGMYLTLWHDKNVYGLYRPRNVQANCSVYDQSPYDEWMKAWRENQCLTQMQWETLCQYLESQNRISAVLLYVDAWSALQDEECSNQVTKFLGPPLDEFTLDTMGTRGSASSPQTRVRYYPGRCRPHSYPKTETSP